MEAERKYEVGPLNQSPCSGERDKETWNKKKQRIYQVFHVRTSLKYSLVACSGAILHMLLSFDVRQ